MKAQGTLSYWTKPGIPTFNDREIVETFNLNHKALMKTHQACLNKKISKSMDLKTDTMNQVSILETSNYS